MGCDLLRCGVQRVRFVSDDIQRDGNVIRAGQIELAEIASGIDRGVNERIEGRGVEMRLVTIDPGAKGRADLPAMRNTHGGLNRDPTGEISGRIERNLIPLHIDDGRRHDHAALARRNRCQELEVKVQCRRARGDRDMEGCNVNRIALPLQRAAVALYMQAGKLLDHTSG